MGKRLWMGGTRNDVRCRLPAPLVHQPDGYTTVRKNLRCHAPCAATKTIPTGGPLWPSTRRDTFRLHRSYAGSRLAPSDRRSKMYPRLFQQLRGNNSPVPIERGSRPQSPRRSAVRNPSVLTRIQERIRLRIEGGKIVVINSTAVTTWSRKPRAAERRRTCSFSAALPSPTTKYRFWSFASAKVRSRNGTFLRGSSDPT